MSTRNMYLFAAAVTIFMGHNMVLVKSLTAAVDANILTFLRMVLTALTLVVITVMKFGVVKPTKEQWKLLLLIAFYGVFIHQFTFNLGLQMSSVANSALILGLNPLTISLLAAMMLKEPLYRNHYIGLFLGLIGICFILFRGLATFTFSLGDFVVFLSMLTQALSFIYIRKLSATMNVVPINAFAYLLGSIMLLVVPIFQDMSPVSAFDAMIWFEIILSGSIITALGFVGWSFCLQRLGAGRASIFLNCVTATGIVGSVVYLGEPLLITHILGFIFIALGILVSTRFGGRIKPKPKPAGTSSPGM